MLSRLFLIGLLCFPVQAFAATQAIKTETIRIQRPKAPQFPLIEEKYDSEADPAFLDDLEESFQSDLPKLEVNYGIDGLPDAVRQARQAMVLAAESGNVSKLAALFTGQSQAPDLSFVPVNDPASFLKESSGDGEGYEILAILLDILEAGYLRLNAGTEEETYLWPYFARYPLHELSAPQKVELYKIVTAADYFDMLDYGAWTFYRVEITKSGQILKFMAGE